MAAVLARPLGSFALPLVLARPLGAGSLILVRHSACCRLLGQRDRVFQEAGGARCRGESSVESSRSRRSARDIDVHENVLRKWVKEFGAGPKQAFPGHGQMKPEQLEIRPAPA
jgi:hypothetical protein